MNQNTKEPHPPFRTIARKRVLTNIFVELHLDTGTFGRTNLAESLVASIVYILRIKTLIFKLFCLKFNVKSISKNHK